MRLLLIEDEDDAARMIAKGLRQESRAVDTASDGKAELRQAGLELPILMLTASGAYADRAKGLDLGADDYLVKPSISTNSWRVYARCFAEDRCFKIQLFAWTRWNWIRDRERSSERAGLFALPRKSTRC